MTYAARWPAVSRPATTMSTRQSVPLGLWLRFAPVGLTFIAPLTVLHEYPAARVPLLAALLLLARRVPSYQWRWFTDGAAGVFLLSVALSLLWSSNPRQTAFSIGNLVLELLAALVLITLDRPSVVRRLLTQFLKVLLVGSAIVALLLPSVGRMDLAPHGWQGVFVHKNSLGAVAALSVPFLFVEPRAARRAAWLGFASLILIASDSMGPLVAALTTLAVMALARRLYASDRSDAAVLRFYGAIALLGVAAWRSVDVIVEVLGRDSTLSGRTTVWSVAMDYGASNPILGDGIGAQIYEGSSLFRAIAAARGDPFANVRALGTTHNGYLTLYLGLGLVGCALFLLLCLRVVRLIETGRRRGDEVRLNVDLALGLVSSYLVLNFASDQLLARGGWLFFTYGVAQLLQACRTDRRRGAAPAAPKSRGKAGQSE